MQAQRGRAITAVFLAAPSLAFSRRAACAGVRSAIGGTCLMSPLARRFFRIPSRRTGRSAPCMIKRGAALPTARQTGGAPRAPLRPPGSPWATLGASVARGGNPVRASPERMLRYYADNGQFSLFAQVSKSGVCTGVLSASVPLQAGTCAALGKSVAGSAQWPRPTWHRGSRMPTCAEPTPARAHLWSAVIGQ